MAIIVTIAWSAIFSFLILKILEKSIGLRVSADEEMQGLDIVLHEETGYHSL
jgi:Amt family ammonium transporter